MRKKVKIKILLGFLASLACVGCSLPQIFSITSDLTSSLVYGSLIANELSSSQTGSGTFEILNKLLHLLNGSS